MSNNRLTGKEIIQQSLPDILKLPEGMRTKSKTTQRLWFQANLADWNIEMEARLYTDSLAWENSNYDHCREEYYLCGDKHSVVGRFNQNLCQALTPVLHHHIDPGLHFGDYRCTGIEEDFNKKIPDLVLVDKNDDNALLLVGEAKTLWKHKLEEADVDNFTRRHVFGQIAEYMGVLKCKFGWLTTYNQTIFFKQVPHPTTKDRWVLCYSSVIRHNTEWQEVSSENPRDYQNKVTLRECFAYIAKRACDYAYADNNMKPGNWVYIDDSKLKKGDDHIDIGDSDDESPGSDDNE